MKREKINTIRRQAEKILEIDIKTAKNSSTVCTENGNNIQSVPPTDSGDNQEVQSAYMQHLPMGDPIGTYITTTYHLNNRFC